MEVDDIFIENYFEFLDEMYVGETDFIKRLTAEVSKARAPYVGKLKKPIKGNKDFIKIGDMIAEEFGFYAVTFMVPYNVSMNAFTYPITMNIDSSIIDQKPKFFKDKGLKYDEKMSKLCIIVAVTAGVWFNPEFTDREVVAAILHEVGHSFVTQSNRSIDIIESNRIGLAFAMYYKMVLSLFIMMITKDPKLVIPSLVMNVKNIINSSNKGKEIINQVSKELASHPLFKGFNSVSAIAEYIYRTLFQIITEICVLFNGPIKLLTMPIHLINKILEPITDKTLTAIGRSQEYLSDSFATMYGMGPEISSFLTKIEFSSKASGSQVDRIISEIPIVGALHRSLDIPILLMINTVNTHPSTPARINKILDELNKELKNSDLSPKTKDEIKKNIKELEKIKDECLNIPIKNKYDAEHVKRLWIQFLMKNNDSANDLENYYTDLKERDKYVNTKESGCIYNIELI